MGGHRTEHGQAALRKVPRPERREHGQPAPPQHAAADRRGTRGSSALAAWLWFVGGLTVALSREMLGDKHQRKLYAATGLAAVVRQCSRQECSNTTSGIRNS